MYTPALRILTSAIVGIILLTSSLPGFALPPAFKVAQTQTSALSLSAKLQETTPILKQGVVWYIYEATLNKDKEYRFIAKYNKSAPNITLLAGQYLITATYGQAYLTQKITLEANATTQKTFIINAGGLSVTSNFDRPLKVQHSLIKLTIYSGETDQFGNRTVILKNIPSDKVIMLNAGIYHLVSSYGDLNAIAKGDITVEAGKVTKAALNHQASHVTFKLVKSVGDVALPDTQWELLSSVGEVIKKTIGAIPNFILKSGEYEIRALRNGAIFQKKFTLESGQSSQIEVIAEEL